MHLQQCQQSSSIWFWFLWKISLHHGKREKRTIRKSLSLSIGSLQFTFGSYFSKSITGKKNKKVHDTTIVNQWEIIITEKHFCCEIMNSPDFQYPRKKIRERNAINRETKSILYNQMDSWGTFPTYKNFMLIFSGHIRNYVKLIFSPYICELP